MRWLKLFFVASLVWLKVGCGLPNPYFLSAPTVPTQAAGGSQVTFVSPGYNASGSQTSFVGFEVYYKFLSSTPSGTDINLGGGGFPGYSTLTSNGYFPICLSTDQPPTQRTAPAIAIAPADSVNSLTITLTLNSNGVSSTNYGSSPALGRYVSYTVSIFTSKTFADNESTNDPAGPGQNYQSTDSDVSPIFSSASSTGQAYVNLYVLAYGYEQGTSIVQYSPPVYMGYLTISPFP